MTDEHDFPDYDGDALDKLERSIESLLNELRSLEPLGIADVRVHGTPEAQEKFFAEMALARLEFSAIKKTRTGKVRGTTKSGKPYEYEYKWAPLNEVLAAVEAPLARHGITVWQPWTGPTPDGKCRVTTWVRGHGACVSAFSEFSPAADIQDVGKQITYTRRYSLNAILGVDADADLDEGGVDDDKPPQARQRPPQMPDGPPRQTSARQTETPSQKPAQAPPAAQARPRSEPPPKPAARPAPTPQPAPRAEGGFAARVAAARGGAGQALSEKAAELARAAILTQDPLTQSVDPLRADQRQMVISDAEGDRPTAPVPEPKSAPKGAEVVTVDEQFDPEKFAEFESLTKALNLKGPQLRKWTVERINKPPEQATPADLDFLLDAAKEELQARAS